MSETIIRTYEVILAFWLYNSSLIIPTASLSIDRYVRYLRNIYHDNLSGS